MFTQTKIYRAFTLLFSTLISLSCVAQDSTLNNDITSLDTSAIRKMDQRVKSIDNLLLTIRSLESELKSIHVKQTGAEATDEDKEEWSIEFENKDAELDKSKASLVAISSGINTSIFEPPPQEKTIDINKEISELVYPVVKSVKEVSVRPKEIEELREDIDASQEKIEEIKKADAKLSQLIQYTDNAKVEQYLLKRKSFWKGEAEAIIKEREALQLHLDEKLAQNKSFWQVLSSFGKNLIGKHGLNLLLALLALFISFFTLRFIHRKVRRRIRNDRFKNWRSFLRVADVMYYIFTVLISFSFFIIVLMSASDWLLLGMSILFFIGLLWVGKSGIPTFIEQIKLLLDLGPVREGERVMYKGIPWHVDTMSMYTYLANPDLGDLQVILPITDLIDLRSRPYHDTEPWFPSRVEDWVRLDDGAYGQVLSQTIDTVEMCIDRGSLKTYSTETYLSNNPQNFSRLGFSMEQFVGIHYKYRHVVNEYLCDKLQQFMEAKLKSGTYKDWIKLVKVELEVLAESALELEIFVKFDGGAAYDYIELDGIIQQHFLDALNHYDIEIPYPHMTLDIPKLTKSKKQGKL